MRRDRTDAVTGADAGTGTDAGTSADADTSADAGTGAPRSRAAAAAAWVSAVWLLYVLAQRAFSGRTWAWWWLPADMLPPVLLVLLPLTTLSVLAVRALRTRRAARRIPRAERRDSHAETRRLRWGAAAALCALILGADRSGVQMLLPGREEAVPPGALRVVSFNTSYWGEGTSRARFYRSLRALDADVYLLQEYLRWDEKAAAAGGTPADGAVRLHERKRLRRAFPGYRVVTRGELVTLSRLPVLREPRVAPDRARHASWQEEFTRAKTLRTDLLADGRVLSVYNVHVPVPLAVSGPTPLSPSFFADVRERSGPRRAVLRGLEADAKANPCPLLIAGDFNSTAAMGELEPLRERLRDAARSAGPGYPVSWPDGSPLAGWRLDWAFTGSGVRVHRYALTGSGGVSDHRRQDIRLTPPRTPEGCRPASDDPAQPGGDPT